jgi:uncharacterized OB-fold protein
MTEPNWPDVAAPPEDAVTAPWWAATRERRLLIQTCGSCGVTQHPPRPVCLACMGEDLEWTEAAGDASVDTFTVVHRSPHPDVPAPYVVARVRLAEGPIVLSRIEGVDATDDMPLACGDRLRLGWAAMGDGRALPIFLLGEQ